MSLAAADGICSQDARRGLHERDPRVGSLGRRLYLLWNAHDGAVRLDVDERAVGHRHCPANLRRSWRRFAAARRAAYPADRAPAKRARF